MHCETSSLKCILFSPPGEVTLEVVLSTGKLLEPTLLRTSGTARSEADFSNEARCREFLASCALTIAPACFKRVWVDKDRCRIASEADFFFRIGFFLRKELEEEIRLGGD